MKLARRIAPIALAAATLCIAGGASAQAVRPPAPLASVRLSAGVGLLLGRDVMSVGPAVNAGIEGERWLSDNFAVGGRVTGLGSLTLGNHASSVVAEPMAMVGVRFDETRWVLGAGLGGGYQWNRPVCAALFSLSGTCYPTQSPSQGFAVSGSVSTGLIYQRGLFALSTLIRAETVGFATVALSANLGLGLSF